MIPEQRISVKHLWQLLRNLLLATLFRADVVTGGNRNPVAEIRSATGAANFDVSNAPAPLFRDPVFDGADDPSVIFDEKRKAWICFYTQLRASNLKLENRTWMMGTDVGVAASKDSGKTWKYVGTAQGLHFDSSQDLRQLPGSQGSKGAVLMHTFRAPNVVYHNDKTKDPLKNFNGQPKLFHLHLTYVKEAVGGGGLRGRRQSRSRDVDSSGADSSAGSGAVGLEQPVIVHYVSEDVLGAWTFKGVVTGIGSARDCFVLKLPSQLSGRDSGKWKMWYRDMRPHARGQTSSAVSSDTMHSWVQTNEAPEVKGPPHESPTVFYWQGRWWMLVDASGVAGLLVYSSEDCSVTGGGWTRQQEPLLHWGGTRDMDGGEGRHGNVVVDGGRAFVFYVVHPNRIPGGHVPAAERHTTAFRQSVIQVAELDLDTAGGGSGTLKCKRDQSMTNHGLRGKRRRGFSAPLLKQAFAEELAAEVAATKETKMTAAEADRKKKEEKQAEYDAWKKAQWQKKRGYFEELMAERRKKARPGTQGRGSSGALIALGGGGGSGEATAAGGGGGGGGASSSSPDFVGLVDEEQNGGSSGGGGFGGGDVRSTAVVVRNGGQLPSAADFAAVGTASSSSSSSSSSLLSPNRWKKKKKKPRGSGGRGAPGGGGGFDKREFLKTALQAESSR